MYFLLCTCINLLLDVVFASSKDRTDMDVIRENHQFLWDDEDESIESW